MKLKCKALFILAVTLTAIIISSPGICWGPTGHIVVTEHAIQLLPKGLREFYSANSGYLVAFSMLPDDWRLSHRETGPDHYMDMDLLDSPPFTKIRTDRTTAEKRFGVDELRKAGLLPWTVEMRYGKLVEAMKKQDAEDIVVQSALLAHYVGDAHVPFHATKNYDGTKPEHKGIHFRWEEALPALYLKPESIRPTKLQVVNNILDSAFDWLTQSQSYVEIIFAAEDKARERDETHAFWYYRILWQETEPVLEKQLTDASEALAGVWHAAWIEAGKPDLGTKPAAMYWGR